ncbi:urease accessory protein UreD [Helicobacter burdigaliensis]|uniref:urease accessory protein UreD n=1 Tax=Helicobacter burdigaliensis TaxID=2315334 RepID=UPI000EF737F5|nr:urease accessory protein UreD [Helicobacter burdigaliensis]
MNALKIKIQEGFLKEHYQQGMQRLMQVPIYGGETCNDKEFFAYISTLGGGLVGGDSYFQEISLLDSKATLNSQSNQKIYKGNSTLQTRIVVDEKSALVFHNDANIFYAKSDFKSKTSMFAKKDSKFFYLDGGFIGYSLGDFKANMHFRLFIDSKLVLNDVFNYFCKKNIHLFLEYEYFYTIFIRGLEEIPSINEKNIKAYASNLKDNLVVRVLSNNQGEAIEYINALKRYFVKGVKMNFNY